MLAATCFSRNPRRVVGLSWGVGYVPTGAYEDRVVGYVRRVHEERRGTLRRERLICGDADTLRDDRVANQQQLRGIMDVFFIFKFLFLSRLASVWTGRLVIYYTST